MKKLAVLIRAAGCRLLTCRAQLLLCAVGILILAAHTGMESHRLKDRAATPPASTDESPRTELLAWENHPATDLASPAGQTTEEERIARLFDERVPLAQRRREASELARGGSLVARALLDDAFMVQLIGSSGHPALRPLLEPLLASPSLPIARAAVRGLAAIGGDDVAARLGALLRNTEQPAKLRGEAALGLGTVGTDAARTELLGVWQARPDGETAGAVLEGLGRLDFSAVADTFGTLLAAPEMTSARRVQAVEALAQSTPDAVPFLLGLAAGDADSEVRAASAWAISAHEDARAFGPALLELAGREPAADVRRRLYEALLPQEEIPAEQVLRLALAERDVAARIAGFNAAGQAAGRAGGPDASAFDHAAVEELQRIATDPNSLNLQLRAVFALRRARTEPSLAALAEIAAQARPQVALAARRAFPDQNSSTQRK